jgi:hypothetical protein
LSLHNKKMSNLPYYVSIAACAVVFTVVVSTYATLIPKDSAQNSKLLIVISVFSIVASITAYAIALYHFSRNPQYLIQFVLAMLMLVVLPASLISTAVSTITVSNLRDTLAAAQ